MDYEDDDYVHQDQWQFKQVCYPHSKRASYRREGEGRRAWFVIECMIINVVSTIMIIQTDAEPRTSYKVQSHADPQVILR